jgi:hypothetical protein
MLDLKFSSGLGLGLGLGRAGLGLGLGLVVYGLDYNTGHNMTSSKFLKMFLYCKKCSYINIRNKNILFLKKCSYIQPCISFMLQLESENLRENFCGGPV